MSLGNRWTSLVIGERRPEINTAASIMEEQNEAIGW